MTPHVLDRCPSIWHDNPILDSDSSTHLHGHLMTPQLACSLKRVSRTWLVLRSRLTVVDLLVCQRMRVGAQGSTKVGDSEDETQRTSKLRC